MPDFPFRRNTTIEPVFLPATDVASKTTVPDLRQVQGVTSFGVDNAFPVHIRLVGTGYGAAAFNAAAEGKGWIFGPGKHGPFSTQFPEFMSAIAVDRPGYPIKDAAGALLYPNAGLEVFYGSGNGGWGGAGVPFVSIRGTVPVSGFPQTQQVNDANGSLTVDTGTPGQFGVTVGNFPTTQAVSDANGSLTVDTPQLPATLGIKNSAASLPVVIASDQAAFNVMDNGGSLTVDTGTPGSFVAAIGGSASVAVGLVPIRATNAASIVLKASPGNLYSAYSVAGSTGYILIALDRTAAPAAGAAINLAEVISMAQVPANGYGTISPPDIPDRFLNGCVLIATTSLANFTAPNPLPTFTRGKVA